MLGPNLATALFTLIGVGLTLATWFLLVRLADLELRERWLLALLFLFNGPLLNAVKLGNTSYFILFALAFGLALLRQGRSGWAGVVLGVAAIIKPPLALFALFFALRRDIRGVMGFGGIGAAVSLLSLILFGWDDNLHWFETSVVQYSRGWLGAFAVQSIPAFILRLHGSADILTDWLSHAPAPGEKLVASVLTALIGLIAGAVCLRRRGAGEQSPSDAGQRRDLQYLLVICLCLVSSPMNWAHYFAWLLIPTAFFLGRSLPFPDDRPARVVAWAAIFLVTPLVIWPPNIPNPALMEIYKSWAVSHLLLGGLLWFGVVAWWLARTGGYLTRRRPA
jgi:hypothetical protein